MRNLTVKLIGLLSLILAGCTHNNGYIGDWFGTWQVTEIAVNGEKQDSYTRNMFFKFQTDICNIITVYPHNTYDEHFARFKNEGNNTILIDFGYTDEWNPIEFDAPEESMFSNGPNILNVKRESSREKLLTLRKEEGLTITYKLKKQ